MRHHKMRPARPDEAEMGPRQITEPKARKLTSRTEETLNEILDRVVPRTREETQRLLDSHASEEQGE